MRQANVKITIERMTAAAKERAEMVVMCCFGGEGLLWSSPDKRFSKSI
jgi:hypothetical protein